jgi:hypothetical protein
MFDRKQRFRVVVLKFEKCDLVKRALRLPQRQETLAYKCSTSKIYYTYYDLSVF